MAGTAELSTLARSLTGGQSVSDLLGPGLALSSGRLVATPARLDVDGGSTTVSDVDGITFGNGLTVTDDRTLALAGARGDEDPNGTDAGSAYVFDGSSGWTSVTTETTKLAASDGATALVGARGDELSDADGELEGSAYQFGYLP